MRKFVYFALTLSLIVNILLLYNYVERDKALNTAWSNSIHNLAPTIIGSRIQPVELLNEESLNTTKSGLYGLSTLLASLQVIPEGDRIVTSSILKKVFELIDYELNLIAKIENDLKLSKEVSSEDIEQLAKIDDAWNRMLETLQSEAKKINPTSPIFRVELWASVFEKGSNELNGLK